MCLTCGLLASTPGQWGNNSGHVGVPLEAIPGFIAKLEAAYRKTTGMAAAKKSPGSGPKVTIGKGGKAKKEEKKGEKKPKEKKAPPPKPTMEDLDADLVSYTAQRAEAGAEEPAPVS